MRSRMRDTHRTRKAVILIGALLAFAIPISSAFAYSSYQYATNDTLTPANCTSSCHTYDVTPGDNNRAYNKMWRPIGVYVHVFYNDGTYGTVFDSTNNPVVYNGASHSSTKAGCQNSANVSLYPVTCQTTIP